MTLVQETTSGLPQKVVAVLRYVLITPARNEAASIEQTLRSVVSQTVRPERWVVVSDGSTDATDAIIQRYVEKHPWIQLLRLPARSKRDFAAKVHAFNAGYALLKELDYDVIGSLDADISFEESYIEFLLAKFRDHPNLGVAGTPFREGNRQYDYRFTSVEHVSGACQLFRRECFVAIAGYVASPVGGVDLIAVMTARMKGWTTRSFLEKSCVHHRRMGGAHKGAMVMAFRGGWGDYVLGTHPLWEASRTFYQMTRSPLIIGGLLRLAGFTWAMLRGTAKAIPEEIVEFRRAEQMQRLRTFFVGMFRSDRERCIHVNHQC